MNTQSSDKLAWVDQAGRLTIWTVLAGGALASALMNTDTGQRLVVGFIKSLHLYCSMK